MEPARSFPTGVTILRVLGIARWWDGTAVLPLLLGASALAMTAVRLSPTLGQNDHKRGHFCQELAILTIAGAGALVIATIDWRGLRNTWR